MKKREVSALEYEGLLNVDKMVRLCMTNREAGEFLAIAIQALDQVRRDEGLAIPESVPEPQKTPIAVSVEAALAIKKAMQ